MQLHVNVVFLMKRKTRLLIEVLFKVLIIFKTNMGNHPTSYHNYSLSFSK